MAKIKSYALISKVEIGNDDVLVIETDLGTKTIKATALIEDSYTKSYIDQLQASLEDRLHDVEVGLANLTFNQETINAMIATAIAPYATQIAALAVRMTAAESNITELDGIAEILNTNIGALTSDKVSKTTQIAGIPLAGDISASSIALHLRDFFIIGGGYDRSPTEHYASTFDVSDYVSCRIYVNRNNGRTWYLNGISYGGSEAGYTFNWIEISPDTQLESMLNSISVAGVSLGENVSVTAKKIAENTQSFLIRYGTEDKPTVQNRIPATEANAMNRDMLYINKRNGKMWRLASLEGYQGEWTATWEYLPHDITEGGAIYAASGRLPLRSGDKIEIGTKAFVGTYDDGEDRYVEFVYELRGCYAVMSASSGYSEPVDPPLYDLVWDLIYPSYRNGFSQSEAYMGFPQRSTNYYPVGMVGYAMLERSSQPVNARVADCTPVFSSQDDLVPNYYMYDWAIQIDRNLLVGTTTYPTSRNGRDNFEVYTARNIDEQMWNVHARLDGCAPTETGMVNVQYPFHYHDDTNHTMTGTYELIGNYCFLTVEAKTVVGWVHVYYALPVVPLARCAGVGLALSTGNLEKVYLKPEAGSGVNCLCLQAADNNGFGTFESIAVTIAYKFDDTTYSQIDATNAALEARFLALQENIEDIEDENLLQMSALSGIATKIPSKVWTGENRLVSMPIPVSDDDDADDSEEEEQNNEEPGEEEPGL